MVTEEEDQMVQQNQKTTRKGRGVRAKGVRKNTPPKKTITKKPVEKIVEKPVEKTVEKPVENVTENIINEWGQKVKIVNDISTVEGTLYKDEIVKVESTGGGIKDLRVIDNLGRVWYVNLTDVSTKV